MAKRKYCLAATSPGGVDKDGNVSKTNFDCQTLSCLSSIINEAIRGKLRPFYFFYEETLHTKKHKKQTSDFHS